MKVQKSESVRPLFRLADFIRRDGNAMSAFGPKRTYRFAPHMSAFGGKADATGKGRGEKTIALQRALIALTLAQMIE
ncbi:MAG TPA: hypothetical protein VEH78_07065 [Pseudolabrys sp.]|nr:hypothetical protein [Pseudolabrys sp.]